MNKQISSITEAAGRGARGAANLAAGAGARRVLVSLAMTAAAVVLFAAPALAGSGAASLGNTNSVDQTILGAAQEVYLKWRMPISLIMLMVACYYQFLSSDPRGKQHAKAIVIGVAAFALVPTLYDLLMGFAGAQ